MLRILSLAVLTILAAPSFATEAPADSTTVVQEQQPPQQSPRRGCERRQDEGVS